MCGVNLCPYQKKKNLESATKHKENATILLFTLEALYSVGINYTFEALSKLNILEHRNSCIHCILQGCTHYIYLYET